MRRRLKVLGGGDRHPVVFRVESIQEEFRKSFVLTSQEQWMTMAMVVRKFLTKDTLYLLRFLSRSISFTKLKFIRRIIPEPRRKLRKKILEEVSKIETRILYVGIWGVLPKSLLRANPYGIVREQV